MEQTIQTNNSAIQAIKEAFKKTQRPLILAHVRPDGDAIGSMVGLAEAFERSGKHPQVVISGGLPERYRFLKGSEKVIKASEPGYDLVIALDCANLDRLSMTEKPEKVDINIDHHITNEQFADINFVMPDFAATTAILADYLTRWGLEISKVTADALLMGMITDTIGFRTSNVTPQYFDIAAQLIKKGADLVSMYHNGLTLHSASSSKVWGYALSRLEIEDNLAWTSILLEDRKKASYRGMDDADLTNHLSSLENTDISVLFNEQNDGKVKVSWRSSDDFDVTIIASAFGGGGHPRASGAEVEGDLDEVIEKVLGETKKVLKGQKINRRAINGRTGTEDK